MSSVKPYHSDGSKKEQVADMFNAIAGNYDFLNRVLSLGIDVGWRKKTVRSVARYQPRLVLDVATGTADLAMALAKGCPGAQVEGADISAGMLDVGRQKVAQRGLANRVQLILGDGEMLPFEDNRFDAVTVAFGVRNFENLQAGLVDMLRVLKPGAPLAVLEFSQPTRQPFRAFYFFYFKHILPRIGKWVSRDSAAYTYLPASVEAFPYGQAFLDELSKAGYRKGYARPLTFGIATLYLAEK
ncbi:MAG: bifunctional demethylmenaquinone methyltransferase/2-methoxy-6-polyprenyl-1,4-benzoquinol methylase UbiE [Schleiferiaceae bacterium]|jgi:demethylmenaquinone methyltransferase/2-methoxy-6-polyprenyl-1,4-benzoquinol methylase|nr:bifunctional demethylmenaquinone methyltransferase/2-methoxy-6-polyprenyl-1,4-benzoquinol methylase UbiE [Schleiferiaceae bacterium]MDP4627323.1 bifunctional demethylmenaquinone methyltransferase/2-methoxy-6-polyprenyl-1,4-benzoquinol methylase UbiE [Schleiferiaceae bacterium]MDP4727989.1 bifunctional demethylmenaquinone methyltransferase/2-methoxy-6-polyprenyl-1,4-benzoquinol methylase UbiE [Schleiferiaceae bacterium]MDP4750098.1 bifunctional demethylmenaquinone methyltransferase/2-methoxy-6